MKVEATLRSAQGSSASRRLRRAGRVPAIVYGGADAPVQVELDHNFLFHALRRQEFHSSILSLDVAGGKSESVLLRSVQWHAYKQLVLHVDFQRVDANAKLHTKVALNFINGENSPAVKLGGNVISHIVTELEVSCLPADLPQSIDVDLSNLEANANLHVADLVLPKGVTAVAIDTNPVVAAAVTVRGAAAAEGEEA